jgi:DNA repair exonuclease SbcCD nuclease subunit
VYRSSTFVERKPDHVRVVEDTTPIPVADCVELVGGPWMAKRAVTNPLLDAASALPPSGGIIRICAGHGAVDPLAPDPDAPGVIPIAEMEAALKDGKVHFVALGDRHSVTKVGAGNRIWYSGTPEATDFSEARSGHALVVDVGDGPAATEEVRIGQWRIPLTLILPRTWRRSGSH